MSGCPRRATESRLEISRSPSCDHFSRRFGPASRDRCTSAGLGTKARPVSSGSCETAVLRPISPVPREAPVPRFAGYMCGRCRGTEQQITVVSLHLPSANVRSAKPQGTSVEREIGLGAGGAHATIFAHSQSRSGSVYPFNNASAPVRFRNQPPGANSSGTCLQTARRAQCQPTGCPWSVTGSARWLSLSLVLASITLRHPFNCWVQNNSFFPTDITPHLFGDRLPISSSIVFSTSLVEAHHQFHTPSRDSHCPTCYRLYALYSLFSSFQRR